MSRLTKAWATDRKMSHRQRRIESGRQRMLARLIKIQESEMRHENLNRKCGD